MKTTHLLSFVLSLTTFTMACNNGTTDSSATTNSTDSASATSTAGMTVADWGTFDNKPVHLFTLTNKNGVQVKISDYGATINSFITPDKNGKKSSIVIGLDSLSGYTAGVPYFGATVGRYGNRIAKGKFSLDGKNYSLATNNGPNALHGGKKGFDKVVWTASDTSNSEPKLTLTYLSKDGEEGYPGNLTSHITFSLTDADMLKIEYSATTDKATVLNLTNHSYFNLTGDPASNTNLDHSVMIDADRYTPVDATLIPTGQLVSVKGTPFDFTTPHTIGERIKQTGGDPVGYDHNYVLNKKDSSFTKVAEVTEPTSGRKLEVFTTQPGLQFYSGNFLDGKINTSGGKPLNQYAAFCMETQHFPNSPNTPSFPTTELKPGETYHSITGYKISVIK